MHKETAKFMAPSNNYPRLEVTSMPAPNLAARAPPRALHWEDEEVQGGSVDMYRGDGVDPDYADLGSRLSQPPPA
jgi:hypothetical protein